MIRVAAVARRFEWPRQLLNLPSSRPADLFSKDPAAGLRIIPLQPAARFTRPLPSLPEDLEVRPYFLERADQYSDAQYVAVLKHGSAWGYAHGAVFTRHGEFIPSFARDPWGAKLHEAWRRVYLPAPRRIPGRALYLVTPEAFDNYHHWMIDLLPRLGLIERAGFELSGFDHVLVNHANRRFQNETLNSLGIGSRKIIQLDPADRVQPDELIVPSLKADNQEVPLNQLAWLRERFLPATPTEVRSRRLFLSRAGATSRRLLNEPEIYAILRDYGFESVDPSALSVHQQAKLFAEAEAIVGPSGAAFANLAFCAPGTRVIEFASPRWLTVYHWMISARIGLEHTVVVGDGPPPDRKLKIAGRSADLTVDVRKLRRILKSSEWGLCSNRSRRNTQRVG